MKNLPLWLPFSIAFLFACLSTACFPSFHLVPFAPFFALLCNKKNKFACLWIACGCGLIMDLLCSDTRFGFYAFNYSLTLFLIYPQRHHFFEDKPLSLALLTAIISALSTFFQLVLFCLFSSNFPLLWKQFITDCAIMPLLDALYAYTCFYLPLQTYFLLRKDVHR